MTFIQNCLTLHRLLSVIPAQAGIQCFPVFQRGRYAALLWLDSRSPITNVGDKFRGNDGERD